MNRTKKTKKKRRGVFAALTAALVIFSAGVASGKAFERLAELPDYGMTVSAEKSVEAVTAEIPEDRFLILVNSKNKIPENYEPELTELSNGQQVDSGIYPELQRMFDDMREPRVFTPLWVRATAPVPNSSVCLMIRYVLLRKRGIPKKEREQWRRNGSPLPEPASTSLVWRWI